jgi:hypothetical protein
MFPEQGKYVSQDYSKVWSIRAYKKHGVLSHDSPTHMCQFLYQNPQSYLQWIS